MAAVHTYRRYLHRMRVNARFVGDRELAGVWRAKQEAQPGTLLPATFPFLLQLNAGGYEAREDLAGADIYELIQIARLHRGDAETVLTAFAALPLIP
jgi:hypothetical protein